MSVELTPEAHKLIVFLADHAGPGWPKIADVSRKLQLSELEVLRALRELADKGLIEAARN